MAFEVSLSGIAPITAWATDITYLPMKQGFVYLASVMDWATRRVLSWRVSNTLTSDFCDDRLNPPNSRAMRLLACCRTMALLSAWMAEAAGATMSSLNGSDAL